MSALTLYTRPRLVQQALALLACEVREADALASPDAVRDYLRLLRGRRLPLCSVTTIPAVIRSHPERTRR